MVKNQGSGRSSASVAQGLPVPVSGRVFGSSWREDQGLGEEEGRDRGGQEEEEGDQKLLPADAAALGQHVERGDDKGRADADGGGLGRRMQALHRLGQAQKAVAADEGEDAAADQERREGEFEDMGHSMMLPRRR